ncbi:MAG: D-alanine--D-alanine ligase [Firmicutes bacterium]|nr:D-alanine--D-alanine ligase [Bacillota bacterium]
MKTTVGVVFGCPSVEHEVSVISALQAIQSLDEEKYDIFPIYISKDGDWYWGDSLLEIENFSDLDELLAECEKIMISPNTEDGTVFVYPRSFLNKKPLAVIDVFLPILHGSYGEDGCVQGFLELTGIPYAGPGVLAAAIGMDKVAQKAMCKMGGVPVLDCFWFYSIQWGDGEDEIVDYIERRFSYPVIVKPADLGSSVGVKIVYRREELIDAVESAVRYSQKVLVERVIENLREVNIAVLGDAYQAEVSEIEEPVASGEILSFADKFLQDDGKAPLGIAGQERKLPAEISENMAEKIRNHALDAFYCMNGSGVWRMDFLIDVDTDRVYLNEVNTIPGSLAYYLWELKGLSYPRLLDRLIQIALRGKQRKKVLIRSFDSDVLVRNEQNEAIEAEENEA